MESDFIDDLIKVCKVLEDYDIEYLIVGGTAVALHGYFRITTGVDGKPNEKHDLDIWYNPTYENYFNLLKALSQLGLDTILYNTKKRFLRTPGNLILNLRQMNFPSISFQSY